MNKVQFLNALGGQLKHLDEEEKSEILYDYEEHFRIGLEEGKSEEEIVGVLGDPLSIGKEFKATYLVQQAEITQSTGNIVRAIFATMSLGFFNLIFVLGPFIGLIGVMIGLYAAAFALTISGVVILGSLVLGPILPTLFSGSVYMMSSPIITGFAALGMSCLGLLLLIGSGYLSIFLYRVLVKYLRFNLKMITGRG